MLLSQAFQVIIASWVVSESEPESECRFRKIWPLKFRKCIALLQDAARSTSILACGLMRRGLEQRSVGRSPWVVRSARQGFAGDATVSAGQQFPWPSTVAVAA
jgi:hypothetical protein